MLARRIAETIADWLATGRALPGEDRPIRAGDVMILVQRRGDLFHAIIRALKRARVPVAGADLLRIGGELAVNDLLAALRFAATPNDDLSLAALLRSPLGGLSERELFELAHPRTGSLWTALRAEPAERWPEVRALLDDLLARADYLRPFELLTRILVRHDGRRRLTARLGAEAEDGIDALIDQAIAYESVEAPSLTGFLHWFDQAEVAVKRRMEEEADQVRVMTVHGAKGLEAPIVILPDTAVRNDGQNPPQVLRLADGQPVWRTRSDEAPPGIADAETARRALVRAENRRLLYVALTRARSWLIVAGAGGTTESASGAGESWHALVAEAMAALDPVREPTPDGDTLSLSLNWTAAAATPGPAAAPAAAPLPDWITRPARPPATPPRPVSPSGLGGAHVLAGEPTGLLTEDAAKARGTALHRLLEHLHGRPAAARPDLAARLLPDAPDLPGLLAEASTVLDAPGARLRVRPDQPRGGRCHRTARRPGRSPHPRPHRPAAGRTRPRARHRLQEPPGRARHPDAVPEGILRQMAAYRAALAAVFPGRRIETAVLWTGVPQPDAAPRRSAARRVGARQLLIRRRNLLGSMA